jgi:hypothetical protein
MEGVMRLPSRIRLAEQFVTKAEARRIQGLATYGDFDPEKDKRTLSEEAIEEVVDAYNYLYFFIQKHPEHRQFTRKAKKKAFELYTILRHLKELETTTREGGGN